ncbi:lysophospholipid acyltransferase family protein [Chlorobium phaeobacteroides]|jgi:1-acyl-sn-glycerol-3-phosphate acyltransferase|uniref:1-acyl-sn-glycerol-3-phosphate acyltransferase n=1 Tax=Chlorobium phaeobacteroides (strain DSM 266 / SMG 266 / 2430) TaxID=290317 RepID=A1BJF8_CHLPD|nr:lysophospholipid acyltransferase family protein [Chlorobium phaeobacteroides]ABL66535.1 1-acyl-sn-glycerol-3-phosphate acyltransferase [Chlorobium phaeobacteroides DSM 266]MBV5319672.1 1-acyl-sn-glycerol-3-phosphate acyltransferase [Chlorobium phaeobacteroides]
MNYRTLLFFLILVPIMIIGMSLSLLINLFDRTGNSFHRIAAWWGRFSAKLFGISIETIGSENYSANQHYLVISNHAGMADIPLLLGTMKLNLRFVAKEELGKIPIFGWALKQAGYIMIRRGQNRDALKSLLDAAETLKNGRSIHIFPEGTRSETGEMLPFKRGAFLVAQKGGAPILPVTIIGSHLITPKKSLKIHKGKIRIIIGKPITPSNFESIEDLMLESFRTIEGNLQRYRFN